MASRTDLIIDAINKRRNLVANYHGHRRWLSPHALGTNKQGRMQLLAYQFGGTSGSPLGTFGSPGNWRCLAVEDLGGINVVGGEFRSGDNHSRPQSCCSGLIAEVEH